MRVGVSPVFKSKAEVIERGLIGIKTSGLGIRPYYGDVLGREI